MAFLPLSTVSVHTAATDCSGQRTKGVLAAVSRARNGGGRRRAPTFDLWTPESPTLTQGSSWNQLKQL